MVTIETGQSSLVIFELPGYSHTKYTIKIKVFYKTLSVILNQ